MNVLIKPCSGRCADHSRGCGGGHLMIWIFPIAGRGTRTSSYGKFKPFIPVLGRRILHWCLAGIRPLVGPLDRFIFITTRAFEDEFSVRRELEGLFAEEKLPQAL